MNLVCELSQKELLIQAVEQINLVENSLIKDELPVPHVKQFIFAIEHTLQTANGETTWMNDKEALFLFRLLQAKYEEILDIIELKQAM